MAHKLRGNMAKSTDERIAEMTFVSVYPHYVTKAEKKGRTIEELNTILCWLTGLDAQALQQTLDQSLTFEQLFAQAQVPDEAHLIKGSICGVKVQDIENPLTQKVRYMDKIVDELAKGKSLEKIMKKDQ